MRWDNGNRLVDVQTRAAAVTAGVPKERLRYAYDADGRLIERRRYTWSGSVWTLAESTRYVNDGLQCVAEYNGSNVLQRRHVWGLDMDGSRGGLGGVGGLLWIASPANGVHYAAADANGNVVALFGSTGHETARYEYGPFGEVLRMSGGAIAVENPWRFSSKRQDATTDWVHYEYRVYDPATGRWLSRDPIGEAGGENLYGFVGNDPINQIDRFGLSIGDWLLEPASEPFLAWYEAALATETETSFKCRHGESTHQFLSESSACPTVAPHEGVRVAANFAAKSTKAYQDIAQSLVGGGILSRAPVAQTHLPGLEIEGTFSRLWKKCTGAETATDALLRLSQAGNMAARRSLAVRIARESTVNKNSHIVVIGKYLKGSNSSYEKIADSLNACHFQMKDGLYPELEKRLGHIRDCPNKCVMEDGIISDVFQINATFLAQQIAQGKRILLTHKPSPENLKDGLAGFTREVRLLEDLGFRFRRVDRRDKDGNWLVLWEAWGGPDGR
jgi:RHS repeat-associated protein